MSLASLPGLIQAEPPHSAVENLSLKSLLNGKTIRSITVRVKEIFEDPSAGSFYRAANGLKIGTHDHVIRRELLFKEGDVYDQFKVEESIRNLRLLGFLAKVEVAPKVDGDSVDLEVISQDTWTFIPQFAYSSGTGNQNFAAGVAESNLFGYGKRAELLYSEEESRKGIEGVYADQHVWNSNTAFVGGVFKRNDGDREVFEVGRPFRSLGQKESWSITGDALNTVGRLFENGDERYIYRQKKNDFGVRIARAIGEPETRVRRFSVGYNYAEARFTQADEQDYEDLSLDPSVVGNDLAELAENRRFSGPVLAYEMIEPDFISLNYIDRFERVQDYNLGDTFSFDTQIAPKALGSDISSALFNANRSHGWRFSARSFMRAELGINSRFNAGQFENTFGRGEIKFYQSFLPSYWGDRFLGRHTLAASIFIDYADRLDKDREFLAGGDNLIRGYKANTFAGDKRLGLNLEDRVHFADNVFELVSIGGAAFLDAGGASRDSLGQVLGDDIYSDVGVGLRFAFPRSSGGRVLRVDIAFPLRDGPDGSNRFEPRLVLQGGQLFGSSLRSESLGAQRSNIAVGVDN